MRYHYINIMTVLIFMLLNPLYALSITTLFSIITKRVNNLLLAVLYVLSFTLLFSNQEFMVNSDLGSYIDMYHQTQSESILSIFGNFLSNPNGREFLWIYYSMAIGELTGYSFEVFIFTTYMLIFSLSAYLAFLISENGRYNFSLMLFSLIFFELTFMDTGYDLWRSIVGILILLIGLMKYFSLQSKYMSRVIIYSSAFIHISMVPIIGLYELYVFFIKRNDRQVLINISLFIKLILFTVSAIFVASFITDQLLTIIRDNPENPLHNAAILKYGLGGFDYYAPRDFSITNYIKPFYLMIIAYIVFNLKNILHYELFILVTFIIIEVMTYTSMEITIIWSRASLLPKIAMLFIAVKLLKRFNNIYIIAFVCVIFTLRMVVLFFNSSNLWFLESLAKGELFNPFYGFTYSIFYFYSPLFSGFYY